MAAKKVGRPKIMKQACRILVQVDEKDYKKLQKVLGNTSVAQFFREQVKKKLDETLNAKHTNQN